MSAKDITVETVPHPQLGSWEVGLRRSFPTTEQDPGYDGGAGTSPGGAAPRVLLIGGTGQTIDTWRPVEKTLAAEGHEVVAYASRGIVPSSAPALPWSLEDMVADAVSVLDHLGWSEPVTVVGYSLGGFTAELLARTHPGRVAHAVLVGGHNQAAEVSRAARETRLAIGDNQQALDAFEKFTTFVTTLDTEALTQRPALAKTWWEVLDFQSAAWSAPHAREGQGQAVGAWITGTAERPELPDTAPRPSFTLISFHGDLHMPAGAPAERAAEILGGEDWVDLVSLPGGHGALFADPKPVVAAIVDAVSSR